MLPTILATIARYGERGAVLPIRRLTDLANDVAQLKAGADYLTCGIPWMATDSAQFVPEDIAFTPRSIIVTLSPSPRAVLRFTRRGKVTDIFLPPTYTNYDRCTAVQAYLADTLGAEGYSVTPAGRLPQKLLAVRSGLGQYGRNFICFSPDFGSYQLINSFFTDLPCEESAWYPIRFLPACENCNACAAACPTGALEHGRRMLNANRCLTYLNEEKGDFPDWVAPDWHNCAVGCLKCQDVCPYNGQNRDNVVDGVTFTEAETEELLSHTAEQPFSPALREKILSANLQYYEHILARNLRPLLS